MLRKSSTLVSLHAAKHRFESYAGPLGKWVIWLVPLVFTAREIAVKRTGAIALVAELFLEHISEDRCVLMAMMADASDDGLEFTRAQDSFENSTPDTIASLVRAFAVRVVELYASGKIFEITSYTSHMVAMLTTNPITFPVGGQLKTLGGNMDQAVRERCVQKMKPWVKLCLNVLRAEYPSFELVQSFKVFSLSGSVPESLDACPDVEKLAKLVGVDKVELASQLQSVQQVARVLYKGDKRDDVVGAWTEAARRWEAAYKTNLDILRPVLYRFITFRACTSTVEQNFSMLERYFHKRKENMSEAMENILAKLILDVKEDASESAKVALCEAAQQVWFGNYGRPRTTHTSRVDKGVDRVHRRQADSVTGMVRERRIAAAAVVAASVVMPPTYYRPGFAQKIKISKICRGFYTFG